jgi:cobalt-zinc-cadmium resistance protein CzcA
MTGLVAWAAHNRLLALLVVVALAGFGLYSASKLPIDAVPDVTNTQVQVVTRAPALSASEVETQITQPVEREMAGTPGLRLTRSISKLGISIVTLIFEDSTDVYFARALVNERIVSLRDKISADIGRPELGPISTALGEIFMFELKPNGVARTTEELRTIVDWQIGPRLRQVPGVIEVVAFGGAAKQYRVTLDPAKLAAHSMDVADVRAALMKDNRVSGGGYVEQDKEQVVLRGDARYRSLEDIAATAVRTDENGVAIRVGNLGEVDTGPGLRQGAMTRDGRGEVVGASVLMLKGQNSREVVTNVKRAIANLEPYLPQGVAIEPYYDRASFIDAVIKTIGKNLSEGALITVLCLLLTLGSLKAGLLVAGAIPFALLMGFIGLRAVGYSGNVMSLGAIDFGIIVEGAVLTVEHAMTHGATVADRQARQRAIVHAIQEVTRPALFVVTITLLVFLPLSTLQDIEGKMFRPVVLSLCFMLLGAIVYALVFIPTVAPMLLPYQGAQKDPWFARAAQRAYAPMLNLALRRPLVTIGASFGVTIVMLAMGGKLGADFLPRVFEGSFAIDVVRQPSASLSHAIELSHEGEMALKQVPEVATVVSRIGRPEGAVDPAGPESSDVFVILKPRSEWRKGLTPESLMNELSARVDASVPATINAFSQPIEMRINDLVAGVRSDIAVKIFGEDLTEMSGVAEQLRRTLGRLPGASNFRMEIPLGQPSVQVTVARGRAARVGVSASDVLDTLTMSRAGLVVGNVREGERIFDLALRLGGDRVGSPEALARLPLITHQHTLVPLAMVADISEERSVVQVSREQMRRRLVVQGNVRGRDIVSFVNEAQQAVANLGLPKSVELEWGGQFQNFNRAKQRLLMLVPISLAVIAVMLVVAFRSSKYMLITVLNLPFALAGGVLGLVMRGLPFSIPAGVGFIALCGVSVCTGIVMTNALLSKSPQLPAIERVRESALGSLRARISTALIAAVGFIPAATATGAGAEVQRPLATVVIAGLVISMFLSLLALPAMLLVASRRDENRTFTADSDNPGGAHA